MCCLRESHLIAIDCIEASQEAHKSCKLPVQMPLYSLYPLLSILKSIGAVKKATCSL